MAGDAKITRWLPLESNPEVINNYLAKLGVSKVQCTDVYGLDSEMLDMVPKPVLAVFLLFPITGKVEEAEKAEIAALKAKNYEPPAGVFFITQKIGNACGTIALLHALANNEGHVDFGNGHFKAFFDHCKSMTPQEKCAALESDHHLTAAHEDAVQEGETATPSRDEKIDLHFIAFINKNGVLLELDGRKPFPLNHGKTTDESFLLDTAKLCKKAMELEPGDLRFTVLALSGTG